MMYQGSSDHVFLSLVHKILPLCKGLKLLCTLEQKVHISILEFVSCIQYLAVLSVLLMFVDISIFHIDNAKLVQKAIKIQLTKLSVPKDIYCKLYLSLKHSENNFMQKTTSYKRQPYIYRIKFV